MIVKTIRKTVVVLCLHNPTIYNPEYTNPNDYITLGFQGQKTRVNYILGGGPQNLRKRHSLPELLLACYMIHIMPIRLYRKK